jgi:LAS superfamily LD-carboxypeptidase LdcB
MKKFLFMLAVVIGCSISAKAQIAQVKQTEQKTQKKGINTKQVLTLKSNSSNAAIAPLILPLPKNEVDTTFMPVVRELQRKR